ncbi:2-acylglycerol O-acyltransferase 1 [Portunus trituberculatus]|uniref:Acyltransferase n=1 Tax=Portunus trituberculatus TaxID=210409 RepID=A0A5B7E733_PORTR|nr:2-acylglycerol O-acyltransferase 1 [Portunus trituberculatus]
MYDKYQCIHSTLRGRRRFGSEQVDNNNKADQLECDSAAPLNMDGCKVATAPDTGMEAPLGPQSTLKEDMVSQRVEEITPNGEHKAPSEPPAAVKNEPKEQNGVKHEGSSKNDTKSEESDEDLKKYNRKIPEERSAVKKDEIDAHFDRVEWVRRLPLWKHYRDFFPIHLIKTCELDPSKNYIMGYHPHGILSAGAFCNFATEGTNFSKNFPGFTPHLLTLEGHFLLPFYREFFMASGAVSATRESMDYLLGREGTGRALCLVVGGAKESLDCHPGEVCLHLSKRKGFCKMALRHGASLVPMFSFGENEIYDQVANPEGSLIRRFQNFLQSIIGLAPCLFIGRGIFQYSFGIVPFRKPIYTVVGTPIDVPQVKMPTKEQIVALHEKYVKAVVDLYNKYKHKYSEFPELQWYLWKGDYHFNMA